MGRHRNTRIPRAQQAALLASGAFTSHRRVRNPTRARAASALAVGVLATGAVITATNIPWLHDASLPQSRAEAPARPDDHRGTPAPALPAAPVVTPAVSPSAPQPAPPTVWRADDPDAFRPTPRNTAGAPPPQVVGGQVSVRLTGRGQRSELEPALPAVQEGDQHDVVFGLLLGRDFPLQLPDRQVIARWQNDGPGPAPLDLRVRDGQLVLHGGEGHPSGWRVLDQTLGPVTDGQWCQVGLRVCFSANPDQARVSVWRDGEPLLTDLKPPGGTLYPGQQSYLKVGLHRDASIARPAAVHLRDLQVAQSRTSSSSQPEHRTVASTRSTTSSVTSVPRHRTSSSSQAEHRAVASTRSTTSSVTSVPRQATSSSSAPERGSTGHEATGHGSTAERSTPRSSSSARSSAGSATSSGTTAHVGVPRNTPSHLSSATAGAGSQRHAGTPHGGSTGSQRSD